MSNFSLSTTKILSFSPNSSNYTTFFCLNIVFNLLFFFVFLLTQLHFSKFQCILQVFWTVSSLICSKIWHLLVRSLILFEGLVIRLALVLGLACLDRRVYVELILSVSFAMRLRVLTSFLFRFYLVGEIDSRFQIRVWKNYLGSCQVEFLDFFLQSPLLFRDCEMIRALA